MTTRNGIEPPVVEPYKIRIPPEYKFCLPERPTAVITQWPEYSKADKHDDMRASVALEVILLRFVLTKYSAIYDMSPKLLLSRSGLWYISFVVQAKLAIYVANKWLGLVTWFHNRRKP